MYHYCDKNRFGDIIINHKEIQEKCVTGRTPGEGSEKREPPRRIGRVVTYAVTVCL